MDGFNQSFYRHNLIEQDAEGIQMSEDTPPYIQLLFVHPFPHRSKVNCALRDGVRDIPGVHVNDLYERYPNFYIDIEREQQALRKTDLLVVQHPFYWYSAPAMLKQWQDVVLEYGFAFGAGGDALRGKDFMSVISVGQNRSSYRPQGHNRHLIDEVLTPYACMANHCGMHYQAPVVAYNSHKLSDVELSDLVEVYRARLLNYRPGGDGNDE